MDNYKIGKLIKKLRKEKHLTQVELGDRVGVGDRAVSKWERGLTCPDISIINDLSKILGISSDELLAGELKPKTKRKLADNNSKDTKEGFFTKHKIIIIIITTMLLIFIPLILLNNNKTYVYNMISEDPNYAIDGKIIFEQGKITFIVNELGIEDKELLKKIIKNYEYDIKSGDNFIYRYGYIENIDNTSNYQTINEFRKNFSINHDIETQIKRKEIANNKITIILRFLDENNQEISREINLSLIESSE